MQKALLGSSLGSPKSAGPSSGFNRDKGSPVGAKIGCLIASGFCQVQSMLDMASL